MKTFTIDEIRDFLYNVEHVADSRDIDLASITFQFSEENCLSAELPTQSGTLSLSFTPGEKNAVTLAEFEAFVVKNMNEHLETSPLQPSGKLVLPADEKITIPVVGALVFNSKLKFPFDSYHTKNGTSVRVEWTSLIFDAHSISLTYNVN